MTEAILKELDVLGVQSGAGTGSWLECGGEIRELVSPINEKAIGEIHCANRDDYEQMVTHAIEAFEEWRMVPAPQRGDVVRQIGNALRSHKEDLRVEICSNCHPFFTGKQKLVDSAGRVERFQKRYQKAGASSGS